MTALFCSFSWFLLIHMSNVWIYVMSGVCPSVRLVQQKLSHWKLLVNFSTNFFHTCDAYRHHWLTPFYTSLLTLTLPGVRKVSTQQNLLASFLAHLSTDWDEISYGNEAFLVEHPDSTLRFNEMREITPVLLTAPTNFDVGMLSDIFELIWFKCDVIIDSIKLYTMIIV